MVENDLNNFVRIYFFCDSLEIAQAVSAVVCIYK